MIDRRHFLAAAGAALLWPVGRVFAAHHEKQVKTSDDALAAALEKSGFVYVSPLKADGAESTCHGEVWYGYLDGAVLLITSSGSWKAKSLAGGLDRARVWVGDHGSWKKMLGKNEAFRTAPSFDAKAEVVKDDALLERLLASYEEKYPDEIAKWRDKMRSGYHDGSRVLIRYRPA